MGGSQNTVTPSRVVNCYKFHINQKANTLIKVIIITDKFVAIIQPEPPYGEWSRVSKEWKHVLISSLHDCFRQDEHPVTNRTC